jgi:hypothetical protein
VGSPRCRLTSQSSSLYCCSSCYCCPPILTYIISITSDDLLTLVILTLLFTHLLLLPGLFLSLSLCSPLLLGHLLLLGLLDVDDAAVLHEVLISLELRVPQQGLLMAFMHLPPQLHIRQFFCLLQKASPTRGAAGLSEIGVEAPH